MIRHSMDDDCAAFVNGHIEASQDFDWDLIEPEQRDTVEIEVRRECARALAKLVSQLLTIGGHTQRQFFISANCLAFANHIHPAQEYTGEKIARSIGMNKAAFFRRVNQWRDVLRLPAMARAWGKEGRSSIKHATKKHHEQRKQNNHNGSEKTVDRFSRANFTAGK